MRRPEENAQYVAKGVLFQKTVSKSSEEASVVDFGVKFWKQSTSMACLFRDDPKQTNRVNVTPLDRYKKQLQHIDSET